MVPLCLAGQELGPRGLTLEGAGGRAAWGPQPPCPWPSWRPCPTVAGQPVPSLQDGALQLLACLSWCPSRRHLHFRGPCCIRPFPGTTELFLPILLKNREGIVFALPSQGAPCSLAVCKSRSFKVATITSKKHV